MEKSERRKLERRKMMKSNKNCYECKYFVSSRLCEEFDDSESSFVLVKCNKVDNGDGFMLCRFEDNCVYFVEDEKVVKEVERVLKGE